MKKKRRRPHRINLHESLLRGRFEHALLTTYTFNAHFFEDYCLEKFDALHYTPNLTVLTDQGILDDFLEGPLAERPKKANVRYLLHPISCHGCFHPKIFLLVSQKKGQIFIGSANLSRPGITTNAEMVGSFEYSEEKVTAFLPIFRTAFAYMSGLASDFGSQALQSNIRAIARDAPWIASNEISEGSVISLMHNQQETLWSQILARVTVPVESVDILSLYFDSKPDLLDRIESDLKPKRIRIFTENGRTTLSQAWLKHPLYQKGKAEIHLISVKDKEYSQPLHAKALYFRTKSGGTLVYGSANFSTPALLHTPQTGNAEVMLIVEGIDTREFPAEILFDPNGGARRLTSDNELETAARSVVAKATASNALLLTEAELVEDRLEIDMEARDDLEWDQLQGTLRFLDDSLTTIPVVRHRSEKFRSTLPADLRRRLDEGTTTLRVKALLNSEEVGDSNTILVTNLLEFHSGQSVRKARHIKEAQEDVNQFFRVLQELLEDTDESALLTFLNFCDIPVLEVTFALPRSRQRTHWDGGESMRSLGTKNLVIYRELHGAAISFFDRHYKKLKRHVETGSLNGVSNYLHIFFAMGGVLRAQVERLTQGLEAQEGPLKIQDWSKTRTHIDDYFTRFAHLISCLYAGYLPKLAKIHGEEAVRKDFAEQLADLRKLREDMLSFWDRLELLRESRLRVLTPNGTKVIPNYFSCIFEAKRWTEYSETVRGVEEIEKRLAA